MANDTSAGSIRPALLDDTPILVQYNMKLAAESEAKQLDREMITRGVDAVLRDPNRGRYYLAELDGEIVGQIMITFEWSDWRCAMFWWMQSVYVHADHRQRGAFRSLYEHVETAAREDSGVCGLRHANHAALATYERMGMSAAGYHVYQHDWSGAVRNV
jgi:GNAT superfamily N-acetyltransferase